MVSTKWLPSHSTSRANKHHLITFSCSLLLSLVTSKFKNPCKHLSLSVPSSPILSSFHLKYLNYTPPTLPSSFAILFCIISLEISFTLSSPTVHLPHQCVIYLSPSPFPLRRSDGPSLSSLTSLTNTFTIQPQPETQRSLHKPNYSCWFMHVTGNSWEQNIHTQYLPELMITNPK